MLCDQYSYNFAYFGSITSGNGIADYLIAGPDWNGNVSAGIKQAAISEGNFVTMILCLELKDPEDQSSFDEAAETLRSCVLQPLSSYTGDQPPPPIPSPDFPRYKSDTLVKPTFFEYVDIFSNYLQVHPSEQSLYTNFAEIGVIPGGPFPPP